MLLLNNILGTLFLDWNPFDPVGRILSSVGLSDDEVRRYETPFDRFRHQGTGEPLDLPEDIRTSEEWFDLLFRTNDGRTYKMIRNGEEVRRETPEDYRDPDYYPDISEVDFITPEEVVEFGRPNDGFIGQINLDNIGRDFLCLIYYRQRILDLFREGGLKLVLSDLFKAQDREPLEYTNLNNSLIPVEALTDFLTLRGTDLGTGGKDLTTILTDPPTRHLVLGEVPSFSSMLIDSTNLSRFIRSLSVLLQDGGRWEHLTRVSFKDFDLAPEMTLFRDKRLIQSTRNFGFYVSMSREFCLWDVYRGDRLPSIRQISDGLGIPYLELLRIINFGNNNGDRGGIHRFSGLEFLRDGFSDRLVRIFLTDIERTSNHLTNDSKPDIL